MKVSPEGSILISFTIVPHTAAHILATSVQRDMLSTDPVLVEPGKEVHARLRQDFIAVAKVGLATLCHAAIKWTTQ